MIANRDSKLKLAIELKKILLKFEIKSGNWKLKLKIGIEY